MAECKHDGCNAEVPEEGQFCDAHKPAEATGGEAPAEQPAAEDKPAEGGGGDAPKE